jgi:hypothetical protein
VAISNHRLLAFDQERVIFPLEGLRPRRQARSDDTGRNFVLASFLSARAPQRLGPHPSLRLLGESLSVVVFWAEDGKRRVRCAISREALDDHFGSDKTRNKEQVFQEHREAIEQEARRKYLAGDTEADGSILIGTGDL